MRDNLNREWFKNILILTPVLAAMAVAGFYLYEDTNKPDETTVSEAQREPIARLIEQTSNVKRKLGESLYWNPVKNQETLFNKDSVRTGNDSAATIELSDKSRIELSENSLIVLEKSASQTQVDFKTGDISAKGANVQIKVKDSILASKAADLKLSTDSQNNTQIVVTKGTATLTGKDKSKLDLDNKRVVNVNDKGEAKEMAVPLILNTPKDRITVLAPEKTTQQPFTWTVLDEKLKEQYFQLSTSSDFKTVSYEKTAHQAAKGTIVRGSNYWRVGWKDAEGKLKFSEPRTLKLEEDKRIQQLQPANQSVLDLEPGQETVSFSWTALGEPRLFMIEVAKDTEYNTVVHSKTLNQRTLDLQSFKEGTYFWRVRAYDDDNQETGRSATYQFQIRTLIPQFPQLQIPTNGFKWTLNDPLMMEWKPYDKAKNYRISISTDSLQSRISYTHTGSETKHLWKWAKPGTYYWSVTALTDNGEISGKSVTQTFTIEPTVSGPGITLKLPIDQETVTRDRRDPMDPVVFEWEVDRPIHSGPFTFYISEKPDFAKSLKRENIEATKFSLRIDRGANYYWRVEWRSPSDSNDREISVPFVMKYRINNNLMPPILIEPLHQAKRQVGKKEPVVLRWKTVEGAVSYRVTLERESGAQKIPVLTKVITGLQFTTPPLEPGVYFWSVSSLDKEKVEGPTGQVRTLIVELSKELAAPKLKPPVIK